jgi:PIN domain nuclease of toxin-antitoxin system
MPLLLDTHAVIWWSSDAPQLSRLAADAIRTDARIYVSAASVFEIATKHRLGKLPHVADIVDDLSGFIADEGFVELPVSVRHAQVAGQLSGPSRDPFDRLLVAQAMVERMAFVSIEQSFDSYPIRRLW